MQRQEKDVGKVAADLKEILRAQIAVLIMGVHLLLSLLCKVGEFGPTAELAGEVLFSQEGSGPRALAIRCMKMIIIHGKTMAQ